MTGQFEENPYSSKPLSDMLLERLGCNIPTVGWKTEETEGKQEIGESHTDSIQVGESLQ